MALAKQKHPGVRGRGASFQEVPPPPLMESVSQVGNLHPVTPGSIIMASVGSGTQIPHTDVATSCEVLPPDNRGISGRHLGSFLCLSEDYQVALQAGTVVGDAGEARWDTI